MDLFSIKAAEKALIGAGMAVDAKVPTHQDLPQLCWKNDKDILKKAKQLQV